MNTIVKIDRLIIDIDQPLPERFSTDALADAARASLTARLAYIDLSADAHQMGGDWLLRASPRHPADGLADTIGEGIARVLTRSDVEKSHG